MLGGGTSHTSILVSSGGQGWVVRLDGVEPEKLGLSRSAEWRAAKAAAARGIAPTPVYRNSQLGAWVSRHIEAEQVGADEITALAALLRDIHALPAIRLRLNPLRRALRYQTILGASALPRSLSAYCRQLSANPPAPVLCHNDLLAANRLWSAGRQLALDWEYVAMGDPLFDLAVCIEGDNLAAPQVERLLVEYLQREPCAAEQQRLALQRRVYCELAILWRRAYDQLTTAAEVP